ncbi:MAG: hypothetical protein Q9208_002735 [Pyrenodesmia sp. 3 TL-2023]
MDALMVETVGQPIIKGKRPIPTPSEGEVLIKVTVVGLNPYEHRVRDWGLYVEGRLPVVLGNDIAGTITSVGPNTPSHLKPGTHVFGQTNYLKRSNDQSGLQEYALLDAYTVAPVPSNLSDDDGASLVCNFITPFWAIFGADGLALPFPFEDEDEDKKAIEYGAQTIVVVGAGSNCGKYAVQICALAGFGRIIVTADAARSGNELRSYGATHVVDRHAGAEDVARQIRALVGDGLVYAFDAVNVDHTLGLSLLSDSRKGTLACIVPRMAELGDVGEKREGYEDRFVQGQSHNQPELGAKVWKWLPVWMEQGKVKSTGCGDVIEGLDVERVNKVLDDYRDGRQPPKQVHVHL